MRNVKQSFSFIRSSVVLLCVLFLPITNYAYFLDLANGVRPSGMGGSFVAVADDSNTALFNPAGYARLDSTEFTGMYSDLYSNLNARIFNGEFDPSGYNFISLAVPFVSLDGALGMSWTQFNSAFYQESVFTFSYGKRLWEPHTLEAGLSLDLGISLKVLNWSVSQNEYTDQWFDSDLGKTGFSGDVGFLAGLFAGFKLGLAVENIVPTNVGVDVVEYVPSILRVGTSYLLPLNTGSIDSILSSCELSYRNDMTVLKFGVESQWFDNFLAVRAGVNSDCFSSGLGFRYSRPGSILDFQLDYAFTYPFQIYDNYGSHRVGMTIRYGSMENRQDKEVAATMAAVGSLGRMNKIESDVQQDLEHAQQQLKSVKQLQNTKKSTPALLKKVNAIHIKLYDKLNELNLKLRESQKIVAQTKSVESTKHFDEIKGSVEAFAAIVAAIKTIHEQLTDELGKPIVATENVKPQNLLPDRTGDKIVVGVQQRIVNEFGRADFEKKIVPLLMYLRSATRIDIEQSILPVAELELGLIQGHIDIVVGYDASLLEKYMDRGVRTGITIQTEGRTTHQYFLMSKKGNPFQKKDKAVKVGTSTGMGKAEIIRLFKGFDSWLDNGDFTVVRKWGKVDVNVIESRRQLRWYRVDVIVEADYSFRLYEKDDDFEGETNILARSIPKKNGLALIKQYAKASKNKDIQKLLNVLKRFKENQASNGLYKFFGFDGFELIGNSSEE
jgi:hypothetical protein